MIAPNIVGKTAPKVKLILRIKPIINSSLYILKNMAKNRIPENNAEETSEYPFKNVSESNAPYINEKIKLINVCFINNEFLASGAFKMRF